MTRVTPLVRHLRVVLSLSLFLVAVSALAETMPLSQIKAGMKGYGLTVFEGSKV